MSSRPDRDRSNEASRVPRDISKLGGYEPGSPPKRVPITRRSSAPPSAGYIEILIIPLRARAARPSGTRAPQLRARYTRDGTPWYHKPLVIHPAFGGTLGPRSYVRGTPRSYVRGTTRDNARA
jgi:hypothetical protein